MTLEEIQDDPEKHQVYRLGRIHASQEIVCILKLAREMSAEDQLECVKSWCQGSDTYHPELDDAADL